MKQFACGDVVPGCQARFVGESEDDILAQVGPHASAEHGMDEVPSEVVDQVKSKISDT